MPNASSDWIPGPAPRPKRRRRLGRRLLILLIVLVAPIAGCRVWDSIETRRFWREIDEIDARGERLDATAPAPKTDEQRQASRLYADALRQVVDLKPLAFQQLGAVVEEIELAPEPSQHPKLAELRAFEKQHAVALRAYDRAAALDANGPDPADMRAVRGYEMSLDRVNFARVARLAFEGDGDAAAAALRTTLRMRRLFPSVFGRTIVPQTMHSTHLILSQASPSGEQLRALSQEYLQLLELQRLDEYLIDERARFLSIVVPEEFGGTAAPRRVPFMETAVAIVLHPLFTRRLVNEVRDFDAAIAIAREPWPAKVASAQAREDAAPRRNLSGSTRSVWRRAMGQWMSGTATATLGSTAPRMAQTISVLGTSAIAIAVERYRRAHGDALPATLALLTPEYLPAGITDPFSGREFRFVQDGSGFKVYGVGTNGRDDGGKWEAVSDLQPFRRGEAADLGVSVR